jgi:hypothetical protein
MQKNRKRIHKADAKFGVTRIHTKLSHKYKRRLQAEEREKISLMRSNHDAKTAALNRFASTIGREVYGNHAPMVYRAFSALSQAIIWELKSHRRPRI